MALNSNSIVVIGTFDSKEVEYEFLIDAIVRAGGQVMTVNCGILGSTDRFRVDVEADQVARAGGADLELLRSKADRGVAMKVMAIGAAAVARTLYDDGALAGMIGMGGSGGTSVITAAMRTLPTGVPKICVTTVAGGNVQAFVGTKDITLIPSVVDVAGLNRISRTIFTRAAGAIVGMVRATPPPTDCNRPVVAASMFGNTTQCVDMCRKLLETNGYEVLTFHATGVGGRTMESLIDEGLIDACLDITTTEWADELCDGVFSAGPDRLSAPGRRGIPHLIVPGCVDMVNFGPLESVPQQYRNAGRQFYEWNPAVTLMRTNVEENRRLGDIFAEKANAATGPVAVLVPRQGVSILDGKDQPFCDRRADDAMFSSLRIGLRPEISFVELDANINDEIFAKQAVAMLLELIKQKNLTQSQKK
jgi:uncharacterized protein (UPF0261 family)